MWISMGTTCPSGSARWRRIVKISPSCRGSPARCVRPATTPGARHWACSRPMNASALSSGPRSISNWPSSFLHPPATLSWPVFRSAAVMPAAASTACPPAFPRAVRNSPIMPSARHASRCRSFSSPYPLIQRRERNISLIAKCWSSSPATKARSLILWPVSRKPRCRIMRTPWRRFASATARSMRWRMLFASTCPSSTPSISIQTSTHWIDRSAIQKCCWAH